MKNVMDECVCRRVCVGGDGFRVQGLECVCRRVCEGGGDGWARAPNVLGPMRTSLILSYIVSSDVTSSCYTSSIFLIFYFTKEFLDRSSLFLSSFFLSSFFVLHHSLSYLFFLPHHSF